MFEGVIKIHDLDGRRETEPAHARQAFGPINQQHDLRRQGQATPQGFLAEYGAKLFDAGKAGNIRRRFIVAHRLPLRIGLMLVNTQPR